MNEQATLFLTELEVALKAQARLGQPIGYLELAGKLALAGPHRIHRLTQALEVLARRDHAAGRPLRLLPVAGKPRQLPGARRRRRGQALARRGAGGRHRLLGPPGFLKPQS